MRIFLADYVVPALIGSGSAFLALRFLVKLILKQALDKGMEKYKAQLQAEADHHRTNLTIYANEREIAYQRIDTQRAQAIHDVYKCISELTICITQIITGSPDKNASLEKLLEFYGPVVTDLNDQLSLFGDTLRNNAIYFDNKTYVMLHKYFEVAADVGTMFQKIFITVGPGNITIELLEIERKRTKKALEEKLTPIHQKTVDNFRCALGIEKETAYNKENSSK